MYMRLDDGALGRYHPRWGSVGCVGSEVRVELPLWSRSLCNIVLWVDVGTPVAQEVVGVKSKEATARLLNIECLCKFPVFARRNKFDKHIPGNAVHCPRRISYPAYIVHEEGRHTFGVVMLGCV